MNFQLRNNRYQLLQQLADEDLTHSYLAKDTQTDEEVIVEILQPRYAVQKVVREQFLCNGELLQSIQIPNVIKPIYLESSKEICYQVWNKTNTLTLEEQIGSNRALSREQSLQIAYEITLLLEALHNQGLILGNLSSTSIYYTPNQPVQLKGSLLLSKERQSGIKILPHKKQAPFAVHYLSPEQLRGEAESVQSDLYALGVILYRAVSGSFPNQEPNRQHPKTLSKDPKILALLLKLLDEQPSMRFESAKAARRVISQLMRKQQKFPIKLPWIVGGAITAAVVIASIPLLGLMNQSDPISQVPTVEKTNTGSSLDQPVNPGVPNLEERDSTNPSGILLTPNPNTPSPNVPTKPTEPTYPPPDPEPTIPTPPPIKPKPPTYPPPDPETETTPPPIETKPPTYPPPDPETETTPPPIKPKPPTYPPPRDLSI